MAKVPLAERGAVQRSEGARVQLTPAQSTRDVNTGELDRMSGTFQKIAVTEAEQFHKASMDEFSVEASKLRTGVLNEVQKLKGKNAAGAAEMAEEMWTKGMAELQKRHIYTPRQNVDAGELDIKWKGDLGNKVNAYASGELQKYKVQSAADMLDDLAAQSGQLYNELDFQLNLEAVKKQSEYYANLIGVDAEDAQSQATAASIGAYVQTQLDRGDPIAALKIFNKYKGQVQGAEAAKLEKTYGKAINEKSMDVIAQERAHAEFGANLAEGAKGGKSQKKIFAEIMADPNMSSEIKERTIDKLHGLVQDQKRAQDATDQQIIGELSQTKAWKQGDYNKAIANNPSMSANLSNAAKAELHSADRRVQVRKQIWRTQVSTRASQRFAAKELARQAHYVANNEGMSDLRLNIENSHSGMGSEQHTKYINQIEQIDDPLIRAEYFRELDQALNRKQPKGASGASTGLAKTVRQNLEHVRFRDKVSAQTDGREMLTPYAEIEDEDVRKRVNDLGWRKIQDLAELDTVNHVKTMMAKDPTALDNLTDADRRHLIEDIYYQKQQSLRDEEIPGVPRWQYRTMNIESLSQSSIDLDSVENTKTFQEFRRALKALGGSELIKNQKKMENLYGTYLYGRSQNWVAAVNNKTDPGDEVDLSERSSMPFIAALNKHIPNVTAGMVDEVLLDNLTGGKRAMRRETVDALIKARQQEEQIRQHHAKQRESMKRFNAL